jgi:voltage-gated potassium channel
VLGRRAIERRLDRFLRDPASIRGAMGVIVSATAAVVVVAGIVMHVLNKQEYPTIWVGMWWAMQTVTTVGYGDVTPKDAHGRIVASLVMLEGIAFLAIVTAAITSTFVERANTARDSDDAKTKNEIDERFDELERRLDDLRALIVTNSVPGSERA